MRKNKKYIVSIAVLCFLTFLLAVACAPASQKPNTPNTPTPPGTQTVPPPNTAVPEVRGVPEDGFTTDTAEGNKIAKMLADKVTKIEGVNSATVVLTGNTALCGIDVKANISGDRTDKIKQEATDVIKAADKRVQTVSVTMDADTVTRIRDVANGINAGQPIGSFTEQIAEIIKRITPTVK